MVMESEVITLILSTNYGSNISRQFFNRIKSIIWSSAPLTLYAASAAVNFWKHCDKNRKLLKKIHNFGNIYRKFPYFCRDVLRVVFCRFVVYGKGLKCDKAHIPMRTSGPWWPWIAHSFRPINMTWRNLIEGHPRNISRVNIST